MIQIFADGALAYDSRLEKYDLAGLQVTNGINTGGTATIILPLGHPAYNSFIGYKTVVTIYRDGALRFRGRALYSADTFHGQRTITCEGELCFLRDTINRPYLYEASPRSIFVTIINAHNAATDDSKKFVVGDVTVTDPNNYIRMESESAETTLDTLNKLVERLGGYIVFTTEADGSRAIHYLESLDRKSGQSIEFGENLLDFTSTGANTTSLVTGLVPYGAKSEETGKRITIASVNGGKDYILAEDAKDFRGTIMGTKTWDDVTEPANLLKKARVYLDSSKVFVTSLELTALDLSYLDKSLDSFTVGDMVRVVSAPHGVNEDFQLSQMTEDLLNPAQSRIVLGKDLQSLTGTDVSTANKTKNELESTKSELKKDLAVDKAQIASDVEASVLEKTSGIYVPRGEMEAYATKAALETHEQNSQETYATKTALATHEKNAQDAYATKKALYEYKQEVAATYATDEALAAEIMVRAGMINKVEGTVHISGGAPVNILGGKIDINGSEINFGKEVRFLNGSGIRIADKDGNFYYVLRVDEANSCVVGNDYTNLYLRGKDAVYLYKTGAAVTSDRRQKNSIEELPEAYMTALDKLTPVRFKYNGRGDRYHVGFVAQDVEAALTEAGLSIEDFGGFVDVRGDGSELGIAYDEFIGLLLQKIRRLEKRIEAMEE